MRYTFSRDDARVVVDTTGQELHLEVSEDHLEGDPFPPSALVDAGGGISFVADEWSAPVYPSVAATCVDASFTPLLALSSVAKAFDDQLYAAVERLSHEGSGPHAGLWSFLDALRTHLPLASDARALLEAARSLRGHELPAESGPRLRARRWLRDFDKDAKASQPVGFYTQSKELERIFRHDRLLQSELEDPTADALAAAFDDPELRARYALHLALISKLTGPPSKPSVLDAPTDERRVLLPPSDSLENRLLRQLFQGREVPEGFRLGQELITRVRDGRLDPRPRSEDGWYAHQFYAISALLDPECDGLVVGPRYRRMLEETFEGLFALTRETHVKQLESATAGSMRPPLLVSPRLTVEPIPEYYDRLASAYAFVRAALQDSLGVETMSTPLMPDALSLADGLVEMEMIFRGAAEVAHEELGHATPSEPLCKAFFRSWQRRGDPRMEQDLRVAVPVFFDIERKTTRLCVTLGLESRALEVDFATPPQVSVFCEAEDQPRVQFVSTRVKILSLVTLECDVHVPPTREELRAICDEHVEPARIKEALEAR